MYHIDFNGNGQWAMSAMRLWLRVETLFMIHCTLFSVHCFHSSQYQKGPSNKNGINVKRLKVLSLICWSSCLGFLVRLFAYHMPYRDEAGLFP